MRELLKQIISICYEISEYIQPVFYQILKMAILASIIGIIVIIIRKILDKKIPNIVRKILWCAVLIALIIPIQIKTPFSIFGISKTTKEITEINETNYREEYENIRTENGADTIIFDRVWAEKAEANPDGDFRWAPDIIYSIEEIETREKNLETGYIKHLIIDVIIPILWVIGIIASLFFFILYSTILKIKLKKKEDITNQERINKILEKTKEKLKIKNKRIKIIIQEEIKTPALFGIITPKILLHKGILELDDKTIEYILLHELMHQKRKDMLKNNIILLLEIIYWFNPILWPIFKAMKNDIEIGVDEKLEKILTEKEQEEYMTAMVEVAKLNSKMKIKDRILCMADNKNNLKRRIQIIKRGEKIKSHKIIKIILATILSIIIIVVFLSNPKEANQSNGASTGTNEATNESTNTEEQISDSFPNPDRIIYKSLNEEKWYVIEKQDKDYKELVQKISDRITLEKRPSNMDADLNSEELKEKEKENSYIVLDYNTISKNYELLLDDETYQMLQMYDYTNYSIENKLSSSEELKQYLEEIKKNKPSYNLNEYYEYQTKNGIEEIPEVYKEDNEKVRYYEENDIYRIYVSSKKDLEKMLNDMNLELEQEITDDKYENCNIIVMLSKTEQKNMTYEIGHINYTYSNQIQDGKYKANILLINKAVNQNCIYIQKDVDTRIYGDKDGKVLKIENNQIYINREIGGTLKINISEKTKISNYRTEKEMKLSEIKSNDYIIVNQSNVKDDTEIDGLEISVIRNLSKEELKQEILSQETIDGSIIDAQIQNNGEGIITYEINIRGSDYLSEDGEIELLEMKFKVKRNTEIHAYGIYHTKDLEGEYAKNQITTIKLDSSTMNDAEPTVTYIDIYDG